MIVNVDYNDIFRYVVGNTLRDPIEVQIDFEERYEMFDESIYDYLQRKLIPQGEEYKKFAKKLTNLKACSRSMNADDLIVECKKLAKSDIPVVLS